MSRMRNDRSDWATMASVEKRLQILAPKVMALGVESLTPNERLVWESNEVRRKPRKKPVQWEATEMENLAVMVDSAWWEPGFERIEARSPHDGENIQRWKEGATSGFPDVLLIIPAMHPPPSATAEYAAFLRARHGVRAALEMKTEANQPKRDPGEWWWLQPFDAASRHGVRRDQARKLRSLHGAGFATYVAYGAAEAFSWLDEQAGPRPDVLPDEWS